MSGSSRERAASFSRAGLLRLALTCLALSSATTGCGPRTESSPAGTQILRISQRNEPADLDPATATLPDEFFIIRALSEGLVSPAPFEPDGPPATPVLPAAAERWEVSTDGLTYTFHLRQDAYWSNGDAVVARDFVESYRRLLTPSTAAPKAALFHMVKNARAFNTGQLDRFSDVGFAATDAHTLLISLEKPLPNFLLHVASGPWIPVNPRVVESLGRNWTRPENFVGNGPFTLAEWRPHQRIRVEKNPRYHSASSVKLEGIHFLAFDNGDAEDRAFRAGQIDVTMAVPVSKLEAYARDRSAELHRAPLAETRYLTFNTQRPPLNDSRVRRALALAIDRQQLVDRVLRGGQEPAGRFVPPTLLPAATDHPKRPNALIEGDAGTARALLADAGFPGGKGFPALELSSWPIGPPVLEAIQQMWRKELDIEVQLVAREAKIHLAALRDGQYDIGLITAIPDVADAANFLADFTTGAPGNHPHWSDETFDQLMAAADRDPTVRAERLAAAEERLIEQLPLAPLYFNSRNWLMSSHVRGWQYDALWTRFYRHVELTQN